MQRSLILCLALALTFACGEEKRSPAAPSGTPPVIVAEPSSLRFTGIVVEIEGGPVAGAAVSAKSCDETPAYHHLFGGTETNASGDFDLTVGSGTQSPIGCVYLSVTKDRFVEASAPPTAPKEGLLFRLQRLRQARGTVVEIDGGPVAGVTVTGSNYLTTTTSAKGVFVLGGVGRWLDLSRAGYVDRTVRVPEGQDVDLGAVSLQRAITLSTRSRISSRISSADLAHDDFSDMYDQGLFCSPCKLIELETEGQTLEIQLRWSGDIPLTLWAGRDYYDRVSVRVPRPGDFSVTMAVPVDARVLLVGARSTTPDQQSVPEPIPFELTATVTAGP